MRNKIIYAAAFSALTLLGSCSESFLEKSPQGALSGEILQSKKGAEALLNAAYAALDGWLGYGALGGVNPWNNAPSNWVYGDITSDDCYKGSENSDQPQLSAIERWAHDPSSTFFIAKWGAIYDGVARCNEAIRAAENATDIGEELRTRYIAEARFLRAHYHFDAKKIWNNVPYIDEDVADFRVENTTDIWPMIEEDLTFAANNLPAVQAEIGRATSGAANAYLGRVHLFQQDYAAARIALDAVINSGLYDLEDNFDDNFNADTENGPETVFAIQMSANDGTNESANGNWGDILNYHGPLGCCGFKQPSQNLVNAYQTDANGLPLLDTFNDTDVTSDDGLTDADPFTEHTGNLDPRLDWTVGRRGIPYLGWGEHPGSSWIRDANYAGPYIGVKGVYRADQQGRINSTSGWSTNPNAINLHVIRYADVLLMRAEVAVEESDLATALTLVNEVRARARDGRKVTEDDGVTEAANYVIDEYTSFPDADYARKAVHFERRIELALEGHRFFDLVRYGTAATVLNAYVAEESTKRTYLTGASFRTGVSEYFPIPQGEIDVTFKDGAATLTQNPGY